MQGEKTDGICYPMQMKLGLANITCLTKACEELGISYQYIDKNKNVVSVDVGTKAQLFVNFSTPFNSVSIAHMCIDKEFTYQLLHDIIAMPRSEGYFDPQYFDTKYDIYKLEKDHNEILIKILSKFTLPLIVKMNTGSQGRNVFLCHTESDIIQALHEIYNKNSRDYDYVALAQEYIAPKNEYRVIVLDKKIKLVYRKDISEATFAGNLSPLHYTNAKAVHVTDTDTIHHLQTFIEQIFTKLDLEFSGMDIIEDTQGKFFLLELNTKPGFGYFIQDNGDKVIVDLYKEILTYLKSK